MMKNRRPPAHNRFGMPWRVRRASDDPTITKESALIYGAGIAWMSVTGFAMARDPWAGLAVGLAPIGLYLIIGKAWFRTAAVIVGGLFILGSSDGVGGAKVVYAAVLILCAIISAARILRDPPLGSDLFRPLIWLGLGLVAVMALGTLAQSGSDITTVVRQGLLYLMLPIAPIIGLDAGRSLNPKTVMRWIAVIGTVAAVGFAVDWLNRRGVSSLSIDRFIVSSLLLPALAFSLATVMSGIQRGWSRLFWLVPLVTVPVAMLITGTRTNLIVFLALLGIVGAGRYYRVNLLKIILVAGTGVASVIVLLPIVGQYVVSDPHFLTNRINQFLNVAEGRTTSDGSFLARQQQYHTAAQYIDDNFWLGAGPGLEAGAALDTPLATVAKLGIIGTAFLVLFLVVTFVGIEKTGKRYGYTPMHTAVRGVALVFLANIPFGTPVEDRGFGFMMILIFMGIAASVQHNASEGIEPQRPLSAQRKNGDFDKRNLPRWAANQGNELTPGLHASSRQLTATTGSTMRP